MCHKPVLFQGKCDIFFLVREVSKGLKSKENGKQKMKLSGGEEKHRLCYLNCLNWSWCILLLNHFWWLCVFWLLHLFSILSLFQQSKFYLDLWSQSYPFTWQWLPRKQEHKSVLLPWNTCCASQQICFFTHRNVCKRILLGCWKHLSCSFTYCILVSSTFRIWTV